MESNVRTSIKSGDMAGDMACSIESNVGTHFERTNLHSWTHVVFFK